MTKKITFAQISDSHLFADINATHCGANVFQNLVDVFRHIDKRAEIEFMLFTGDLTQDHSHKSYHRFVQAYQQASDNVKPVYYLPGNHDDLLMLQDTFNNEVLKPERTVELEHWQIQLLNSKSDTPAGVWSHEEQKRSVEAMNLAKHQLLAMHHHAVDVGYFIDRHGLKNQTDFYQFVSEKNQIKAVLSGHIHNGLTLDIPETKAKLYTCPATSIQFDKMAKSVADSGHGPGYRIVSLSPDGTLDTELVFIRQ